jgi:hypothetical protein
VTYFKALASHLGAFQTSMYVQYPNGQVSSVINVLHKNHISIPELKPQTHPAEWAELKTSSSQT